jgi:hypothetical protein
MLRSQRFYRLLRAPLSGSAPMPENRETLAAAPKASLEKESTLRCGPGSGNYSDCTIIRYNISHNHVNQIIQFGGAATNTQIYNNIIYIGSGLPPIIFGAQVLTEFDIVKAAGGKNIVNIQQFAVNANSTGQFVITFNSVVIKSLITH